MTFDAQTMEDIILAVLGVWAMWKLDQLITVVRAIAYRPDPTGREAQVAPTKEPPPKYKPNERNLYVPESIVPKSFNSRFQEPDES